MTHQREILGMPIEQRNAWLESPRQFLMRVGIPHRGGRLAFHAFREGYAAMVSANAFWDRKTERFSFPSATDLSEVDFALDSAGYVSMKLWKDKGRQRGMAGIFPWTYAQYIEFATQTGASWWSQPDLCVEPDVAQSREEVDFRIRATATLLEGVLRILYEWQNELAKACNARTVANMLPPPVPVLQGWTVSDYQRSAEMLQQVWERWQPWLAAPALIGVGSVCRRTVRHPKHGLLNVLAGLEGHIPFGSRVHLFGVKGACLSHLRGHDWIASADSMAYDVAARRKAWRAQVPNRVEHRAAEMSAWMGTATDRVRPAIGDQSRLAFF